MSSQTRISNRFTPADHTAGLSPLGELAVGLLAVVLGSLALIGESTAVLVACGVYFAMAVLILWFLPPSQHRLGAANRVTLIRGALVTLLAGTVTSTSWLTNHPWPFFTLALIALALDGVDGWLARRTGTATAFGARFDLELDAFFILVLCAALFAANKAGGWVFAIGFMRYAFVLAGRWRPWLSAPLPESFRRKTVCVWQIIALLAALLPMTDAPTAAWFAGTALAALALSFAIDVHWLHSQYTT